MAIVLFYDDPRLLANQAQQVGQYRANQDALEQQNRDRSFSEGQRQFDTSIAQRRQDRAADYGMHALDMERRDRLARDEWAQRQQMDATNFEQAQALERMQQQGQNQRHAQGLDWQDQKLAEQQQFQAHRDATGRQWEAVKGVGEAVKEGIGGAWNYLTGNTPAQRQQETLRAMADRTQYTQEQKRAQAEAARVKAMQFIASDPKATAMDRQYVEQFGKLPPNYRIHREGNASGLVTNLEKAEQHYTNQLKKMTDDPVKGGDILPGKENDYAATKKRLDLIVAKKEHVLNNLLNLAGNDAQEPGQDDPEQDIESQDEQAQIPASQPRHIPPAAGTPLASGRIPAGWQPTTQPAPGPATQPATQPAAQATTQPTRPGPGQALVRLTDGRIALIEKATGRIIQ